MQVSCAEKWLFVINVTFLTFMYCFRKKMYAPLANMEFFSYLCTRKGYAP